MSEDEVERFEITDYDLENEFNINRPGRRISKNKQIYGIWAEDSEEEELPRSSFKGSGSKDYSAPVSFISAGIQNQKKEDKQSDEDENKNDPPYNSSDSENEIEMPRAGFGRRKEVKINPTGGVGVWERHTKGIGAKLLLQMGYQPGKGLGKNLQGISCPVEAKLRKGRGAIGAYGPEKAQRKAESDILKIEDKKSKITAPGTQQWRKSKNSGKPRYFYKTIDEVIEDGNTGRSTQREGPVTNTSHLSKVKVIDMTGPEQRILSGYHAIAGQKRPSEQVQQQRAERQTQHFSLPELQHNLRLLLDMCEQEIIENDRGRRHLADRSVALERDERELEDATLHAEEQAASLETLLDQIEHLEPSAKAFQELQEEYPNEWRLHGLDELASAVATPVIVARLRNWQPLVEPDEPLVDVTAWHGVLDMTSESYGKVLWHSWLPIVKNSIDDWKARDDPESMVKLIEYWSPPLVPLWLHQHVLEQLVLPKIQTQIEEWNPLTDTVPVHGWILPWLPWLATRFETTVFPIIRNKLGSALQAWHASDASAKRMLEPWREVFSQGDLEAFLTRHIVPKLAAALHELVINPHQQHLECWHWAMNWEDMLPPYTMAGLLEKFFFPKWLQVLRFWLKQNPNFDEIRNWYNGWRKLVSDNLQAQPSVKENFRHALELMDREDSSNPNSASSIPGLGQPPPPPPPPPMSSEMMSALETSFKQRATPQSFKELFEMRCRERGILFVPIPNRLREAKQVYRCGKVLIYFDRNVIFVQEASGQWLPTGLARVLSMAV